MRPLEKQFITPSGDYRMVALWALNDLLDDEELYRQIKEFREKGLGGFCTHARAGLKIPYLSSQWMDKIKLCVKYAKKTGLKLWLYDENGWPSGFAGGYIPLQDTDYRCKALCYKELSDLRECQDFLQSQPLVIGIFTVSKVGDSIVEPCDITGVNLDKIDLGDRSLLVFYVKVAPLGNPKFNGTTYVDLLNPKTVELFIDYTYKRYFRQMGEEFGKTIPCIFTDEPSYLSLYMDFGPSVPWTSGILEEFFSRYGYDLRSKLPELFFEVGNYRQTRIDFWSLISDLFVSRFSKKIYDWCQSHNISFTGHYLAEDSPYAQVRAVGNVMCHYRYQHIPGIDHIFRKIQYSREDVLTFLDQRRYPVFTNIDIILTAKQVNSVACQFGRKRTLSEVFGGSGYGISFEDRKRLIDWQLAMGINLFAGHIYSYSLRGFRKRDWPPTLSFQQPWWKYEKVFQDYVARLCFIMSQGKQVVDILVIHPMNSCRETYNPRKFYFWNEKNWLTNSLLKICNHLIKNQHDFHFADEDMLSIIGSVDKTRKKINVGACSYSVVVIPPVSTLSQSTINLLREFLEVGGKVIIVNSLRQVDRRREVTEFFEKAKNLGAHLVILEEENIVYYLNEILSRDLILKAQYPDSVEGILLHRRQIGCKLVFYLVNTRKISTRLHLTFNKRGKLEQWDPFTGKIQTIMTETSQEKIEVDRTFAPLQSFLFILDTSTAVPGRRPSLIRTKTVKEEQIQGKWEIQRSDPNVLLLDRWEYKVSRERWSSIKYPIWEIKRKVQGFSKETSIQIRTFFIWNISKKEQCYLVIELLTEEELNKVRVFLNGENLPLKMEGWWIDPSFRKIPVEKNLIKYGENELLIILPPSLLENMYLIGNFTVSKQGMIWKLCKEIKQISEGNITVRGYPFYAGEVSFINKHYLAKLKNNERIFLEIDTLWASCAKIMVNNNEVGYIPWRPYRLEITNAVKEGTNKFIISLVNDLQNLFGPHHLTEDPPMVIPHTFEKEWSSYCHLKNFGFQGVKLIREEII